MSYSSVSSFNALSRVPGVKWIFSKYLIDYIVCRKVCTVFLFVWLGAISLYYFLILGSQGLRNVDKTEHPSSPQQK